MKNTLNNLNLLQDRIDEFLGGIISKNDVWAEILNSNLVFPVKTSYSKSGDMVLDVYTDKDCFHNEYIIAFTDDRAYMKWSNEETEETTFISVEELLSLLNTKKELGIKVNQQEHLTLEPKEFIETLNNKDELKIKCDNNKVIKAIIKYKNNENEETFNDLLSTLLKATLVFPLTIVDGEHSLELFSDETGEIVMPIFLSHSDLKNNEWETSLRLSLSESLELIEDVNPKLLLLNHDTQYEVLLTNQTFAALRNFI